MKSYLNASLIIAVVLVLQAPVHAFVGETPRLDWVRQAGTSTYEMCRALAVDEQGAIYSSGNTLNGSYFSKYAPTGTEIWRRSIGGDLQVYGCSTDGAGGIYLSGQAAADAFLRKYDRNGNLQWERVLGSTAFDYGYGGVNVDRLGNVYVAGHTTGALYGTNAGREDAFVAKYDTQGNLGWVRQVGTSSQDLVEGMGTDGLGNVYVTGSTYVSNGTSVVDVDAFIAKYDSNGAPKWLRFFSSNQGVFAGDVTGDLSGNVYFTGRSAGDIGGPANGSVVGFVLKLTADGVQTWGRRIGQEGVDIAADNLGNIYVAGNAAQPGSYTVDALAAKYDAAGNLLWSRQLGTNVDDCGTAVCLDGAGGLYLGGYTYGDLGGPSAGGADTFLAHYSVPEPSTWALLSVSATTLLAFLRRQQHN